MQPFVRTRLALQMFLAGAVNGAWQPVLPPYLKSLGFNETQIDVALAAMPAATLLSPMLVGQAADRWVASERLLGLLSLGCAVLMWVAPTATSFGAFTGLFFSAMLLAVPLFPLATSIALQNLPDGPRSFPAVRACGTLGFVTSSNLLSGWLYLSHRTYADALPISGLIALAGGIYAMTLPHTPPRRDSAGRSALARAVGMLRDPGFAFLMVLLFLVQFFGAAYYARGPLFLLASGVSRAGLASLMSVGQLMEICVVLSLPFLYSRWGPKGTMALGIGAWALRFACWARGEPFVLLVAAIALHGVCFACARIAATIYVDQVCPRDARSSAQSLLSLLVDGSGSVLGNLAIGQVVMHNLTPDGPDWRSVWLVPASGMGIVLVAFLAGFRARARALGAEVPPEPSGKPG